MRANVLAVLLSILVSGIFVSPVLSDEPFFEQTDVFVLIFRVSPPKYIGNFRRPSGRLRIARSEMYVLY